LRVKADHVAVASVFQIY